MLFLVILATLAGIGSVHADQPDCETLAERAALAHDVPPGILSAIARVESGRTVNGWFRAWPWTLNQGGRGSFHPDKATALETLEALLETGKRNIDIGCMQINWHWHAHAFQSTAAMMDPVENTRYAARYLQSLYTRYGDWELSIMHYHSRDPQRGRAYARRVAHQLDLTQAGEMAAAQEAVAQTPGRQGAFIQKPGGALIDLQHRSTALIR